MDDRSRWSDDRLDDLSRRVLLLNGLPTDVAVLKSELSTLTRELRANTKATHDVAEQLEHVQLEPLMRTRDFRERVIIAFLGAAFGGGVALVITLVGHA